ncbi:hypothetical protein E2562_011740 [Oryza meyeriana var. granulata]|uniref:Secreted protein n=1 Tax=Oryza meyeriana var. granulata TaxID=110450 RepID=A0A6G1DHQ7_9ORYZ|nr:hypothetical protein E2562_011740 [Oryza meyeriana var. granulata]
MGVGWICAAHCLGLPILARLGFAGPFSVSRVGGGGRRESEAAARRGGPGLWRGGAPAVFNFGEVAAEVLFDVEVTAVHSVRPGGALIADERQPEARNRRHSDAR